MRPANIHQCICTAFLLCVSISAYSQTYDLTVLHGDGGGAGANSVNARGWIAGQANKQGNSISHAAIWINGSDAPKDLGTLGSPDLNSAVAWPVKANNGMIVGISDTNEDNPLGEEFSCWAFYPVDSATKKVCKGFVWRKDRMEPLPAFPGGYNSFATGANSQGQIVGWAENGIFDSTCDTRSQLLQFRAVIWQPNGEMQELLPLPGDSVSAATAINDKGQVVGISGDCGIAIGGVSAKHAVIWENGVPTNIGDLGGHQWNTPTAITNDGIVVGFSLPEGQDGTFNWRSFVWTKETGIKKLNDLPGTTRSIAYGVNADGKIVGYCRVPGVGQRAVIWQNSTAPAQDLNHLVSAGSPTLIIAGDINNDGLIVGYLGNGLAFSAKPRD